jgi:EpsI family protein
MRLRKIFVSHRVKDGLRFGCVTFLLLVSTTGLRVVARGRPIPLRSDFKSFPAQVGKWSGTDLPEPDSQVKSVLRADNYLWRRYHSQVSDAQVDLWIVYYQSQESGDTIHSPKNCFPGAGWEPVLSDVEKIPDPAAPEAHFPANRYVIEKDGVQQDALYWYQAHGRKYASEYLGKIYLVWDGIKRGRTDGALIRLTAVRTSSDNHSFPAMMAFAQDLAPVLTHFLPD